MSRLGIDRGSLQTLSTGAEKIIFSFVFDQSQGCKYFNSTFQIQGSKFEIYITYPYISITQTNKQPIESLPTENVSEK